MPPVEATAPPPVEEKKGVIGFIYPPPEVRNIVDKTANFVARNGPEFEARIRQNEQNNAKFNFLSDGDPYHAYYQHKVNECRSTKGAVPDKQPISSKPTPVSQQQQQKQQELFKAAVQEATVPKEAPAEFEFIADPPCISAFDLNVVRLTAQFVARNGRSFLTTLMNREQRNNQFDFLRPQHSLFQYFTRLLEQYTKVLIPPKDVTKLLLKEAIDPQEVMKKVKYRVDWEKHQAAVRQRQEEELERERVEYTSIDWHDFSVVETIDYSLWEVGSFPPPTTPSEVGKRVLQEERGEDPAAPPPENDMVLSDDEEEEGGRKDEVKQKDSGDRDTQVQDMEQESSSDESSSDEEDDQDEDSTESSSSEESDEEDEREETQKEKDKEKPPIPEPPKPPPLPKEPVQPVPMPPTPSQVVVKEYDPKQQRTAQANTASEEYLVSPITGEKIPADKVGQHLKINMLDPRWLEDRDRQLAEKTNQENVFATGDSVKSTLKKLAERRTDIFGAGDEETGIGKKIGEEEKREEKVVWDGHTASMEAATRAARANITINEQIHQIHKVKGLLPDTEKEKIGPQPKDNRPGMEKSKQIAPPPPPPPKSQPHPPPKPPQQPPLPKPLPQPPLPPPPSQPPQPHQPLPQPPMMPQQVQMNMGQVVMMPRQPQPQVLMQRPGFVPQQPQMGFMGSAPGMQPMLRPVPPGPPISGPITPSGPVIRTPTMPIGPSGPTISQPIMDDDDEPAAKRARTEESLVPEEEWSRRNPGITKFKVHVPAVSDKPEWRLHGQMLQLALPLSDPVSVAKARIYDETGLPPGKQKLARDGLFFKDALSLAYYNIGPGTIIQLQLKERGGRKK